MTCISRSGFVVINLSVRGEILCPFVVSRSTHESPVRGEPVEPQAPLRQAQGERRYASIASFACSYNCKSILIESFICYCNCKSFLIESFICYCNSKSILIESFICYCNGESHQCFNHNKPCVRLRFANRTYKSAWSGSLSAAQRVAYQH